MEPEPHRDAITEDEAHASSDPFDTTDKVLAAITAPVLAFGLMFATSGLTVAFGRRGSRRKILLGLLALEVLIVVAIVLAVTR